MDTRYLYEVRPVRPINIGGKYIRRPCSMQLTKSEVLEFMKSASVYRRFSNINMEPIRVTGECLDILHQATYNPNYKSIDTVSSVAVVIPTQYQEVKSEHVKQKNEETCKDYKIEEQEKTEEKKLKEEESSVISSESIVKNETSYKDEEISETIDDDNEEDTDNIAKMESDSSSEPEKNNITINSGSGVAQFNLKGNKNNHNKNGKNNYKK